MLTQTTNDTTHTAILPRNAVSIGALTFFYGTLATLISGAADHTTLADALTVCTIVVTGFCGALMIPAVRTAAALADMRTGMMLHSLRAVFALVIFRMYISGELPARFSIAAILDGLFVGLSAPLFSMCFPMTGRVRRVLGAVWNTLGLGSLLFIFGCAGAVLRGNYPTDLNALLGFPVVTGIIFALPMLIIAHILALLQVRSAR